MPQAISQMAAAPSLTGNELVEVAKLSVTVTITGTNFSAQASDNSFNHSGDGFVTAGFAVGDRVNVAGFTGNAANNIFSALVTTLTAGKMVIGGTDGDVIVDDAAGESVTITKWETRRTTVSAILAGAGVPADAMAFMGAIDCSANPNYPAADAGHVYKISVAGKIGGGAGLNVEAGDTAYCTVDGSAAGTQAAVGANWVVVQVNVDGAYYAGGPDVAIADGGTGAGTAAGARANLQVGQTVLAIACSDETTALTTGTAKATFINPFSTAFNVAAVVASLTTAQASGSIFTVDINEAGTSILSTKLTIDNTEKNSSTAATPAVISDASIAAYAEITVDIDQIGTSGAAGLKVYLIGYPS